MEWQRQGKLEEAQQALSRALDLAPELAPARYELGNCLRRLGRNTEAEAELKIAIDQDPALLPAWFSLAYLYKSSGQVDSARDCLMRLCRQWPANPEVLHQAGGLLAIFGCLDAAAHIYTDVVRLEPIGRNYQRLGEYQQKLGQFAAAAQAYARAIELEPTRGAPYMLLANTRLMQASDQSLHDSFTQALERNDLEDESRACIHFALGKLHDDWTEYEQAFTHYRRANDLRRKQARFSRDEWLDFVDRMRRTFGKRSFPAHVVTRPAPTPGFIIGMLRSGTTLVERLLGNNPDVRGLGETELLDAYIDRLAAIKGQPYPDCVATLSTEELAQVAADMRQQLALDDTGSRIIFDKNPLNFMHIGLIALLFPDAVIVHCRREPMDTCLSIYFQNFAHRRNDYAYDLADIGAFYAGYERLMKLWQELLPDRLLQVDYERLVSEPEAVTRELHAAIGLDWMSAATRPEQNPATISTASLWQARQAIYTRSVGRWHNYNGHLDALRDALATYRTKFAN